MDVEKVTHQWEVDKAPARASSPQFPCPAFVRWQLRRATSIVRESRYDAQQGLRAAGC